MNTYHAPNENCKCLECRRVHMLYASKNLDYFERFFIGYLRSFMVTRFITWKERKAIDKIAKKYGILQL